MIETVINEIIESGIKKDLLLHTCCAPCAVAVLEYLLPYFNITTIYCEDNIRPMEEFDKRELGLRKLLSFSPFSQVKESVFVSYNKDGFNKIAAIEQSKEGQGRCVACFNYRLEIVASYAARIPEGMFFATTLTISPHKNAQLINAIGEDIAKKSNAIYLSSDFKKRGRFQRGLELSRSYGLYRQVYCGCEPPLVNN